MAAVDKDKDNLNVNQTFKEYKWFNSCNVPVEIQCGICRLELPIDLRGNTDDVPNDIYLNLQIVSNQIPIHDCPISTFFGVYDESKNIISWDDILTFPVNYRDLSSDAILVITAFGGDGTLFGGTTMRFFDDADGVGGGTMKRGKQKLAFYFNRPGDPNVISNQNATPANLHDVYASWDVGFQLEKILEAYRSNVLALTHDHHQQQHHRRKNEWLDRLTVMRIENAMNEAVSSEYRTNSANPNMETFWGRPPEELDLLHFCFLVIELPNYSHPMLHEEKPYPTVLPHTPLLHVDDVANGCVMKDDSGNLEFIVAGRHFNPQSICIIADWDLDKENLAEKQHRVLAHDTIRGAGDPRVKPNLQEKEQLDRLVQMAGDKLTDDDKDLLYKFRYSLTDNRRALVKYLLAVDWGSESEVVELPLLLAQWKQRAQADISDALKLLGREQAFQNPVVRQYAVDILGNASDEELLIYLLQLVQALRYEPETTTTTNKSGTATAGDILDALTQTPVQSVAANRSGPSGSFAVEGTGGSATTTGATAVSPLANFLVKRASKSPVIANSFYWYLRVETEDVNYKYLFSVILDVFLTKLKEGSGMEGKHLYGQMIAQEEYINGIIKCQQDAKEASGGQPVKQEQLRKYLAERKMNQIPQSSSSVAVKCIPNPLNPNIKLSGLNPSSAKMFKSAVYPCVIEFDVYKQQQQLQQQHSIQQTQNKAAHLSTTNNKAFGSNVWVSNESRLVQPVRPEEDEDYLNNNNNNSNVMVLPDKVKVMFKSGDDLRQDQLIMQLMQLMDSLFKKVNLDLKLLTYNVLAVTKDDGIMEFVDDSMAFSAILAEHKTVQNYLRKHNFDPKGDCYEITPLAMDTFVKSCAASCVVTYILGIGDRHLDNIMMNKKGQLFHIDFGFIFGQDPKPLPPPFRFTREMADGMGGEDSEHYAKFKGYCCQAYNCLRKSANLILDPLSLMGDAGIEDISIKSDLNKVLDKVQEKFRLDLTDEMADQHFIGLINESLNAIAPRVMEVFHRVAVARR